MKTVVILGYRFLFKFQVAVLPSQLTHVYMSNQVAYIYLFPGVYVGATDHVLHALYIQTWQYGNQILAFSRAHTCMVTSNVVLFVHNGIYRSSEVYLSFFLSLSLSLYYFS